MTRGYELQLEHPGDIFRVYCGKIIGRLIEYFTLLFLFSIVVIMISGTGAIAHEHFGVPTIVGLLGMGIITMITVIFGLKKLVDIIGAVGPVIVVLTIAICLVVFLKISAHYLRWIHCRKQLRIYSRQDIGGNQVYYSSVIIF